MKRFAVDIENINLEEDLKLEERSIALLERKSTTPIESPLVPLETNPTPASPLVETSSSNWTVDVLPLSTLAKYNRDDSRISISRCVPSNSTAGPSSPNPAARQKVRDIRVFCNFLAPPGKKCSFNVRLKDAMFRGTDLVDAAIKTFMSSDEKLRSRFSENPKHYKLFMADDNTGEEEAPIQLDSSCVNFTCVLVVPLPIAQLSLFPQRSGLLLPPTDDIPLQVEIRGSGKTAKRIVSVPADLSVDKLEGLISTRLSNSKIELSSMKIRYGPLELALFERYDFGVGCGCDLQLCEWTCQSLHRFGVTEVIVGGKIDDEIAATNSEGNLDQIRRLDEEEARAYQQFDVIKINKFGVRQQRVIGVDGERVYNMRPLSEVGKTKNPERLIEDIDVVRDFRDRPTYCEIEYNKASKYDTDRIECRNAYDCAMLVEKLRMLKRIHSRRQDLKKGSDGTLQRFFSKLGFGK